MPDVPVPNDPTPVDLSGDPEGLPEATAPVEPAAPSATVLASDPYAAPEPSPSVVTATRVTYVLHAVGLGFGAFGAVIVMGSLLFGWPSILGVIFNYMNRGAARGTWLESHIRLQIRNFWLVFPTACLLFLIGLGLFAVAITGGGQRGAEITLGFFAITGCWVGLGALTLYRVVKGWKALEARRPVT